MSEPTQADREAALVDAIISAYHTTRLRDAPVSAHILGKPMVRNALIASQAPLIAEIARKDAALRAIVDLPFTPAPKRHASEIARAALEPVKEADDE